MGMEHENNDLENTVGCAAVEFVRYERLSSGRPAGTEHAPEYSRSAAARRPGRFRPANRTAGDLHGDRRHRYVDGASNRRRLYGAGRADANALAIGAEV